LEVFQEKSPSLIQKQTPAYSVVKHNWNFKRDRILWSDEARKKELFGSHVVGLFFIYFFAGGHSYRPITLKWPNISITI